MKSLHLNTPKLIKKIRNKNLEQDRNIKKILFKGNATSKKSIQPTALKVNTFLKYAITTIILIPIFVFVIIKFNIYEKISTIALPQRQDYTTAYLNVVSSNSPVQVSFDNERIGTSPIKEYTAPPGNYILHITSNHPLIKSNILNIPITLVSKNLTLVQVQLGPTFRTSSFSVVYATPSTKKQLMVFTHKPGAKVYLDDQYIGDTPLNYSNIENKTKATLKLVQEGYLPMKIQLALHPQTTLHVEAKLHKIILKLPKNKNANH